MRETRCSLKQLHDILTKKPSQAYQIPGADRGRETSLAATLDLSFNALPPAPQNLFPLLSLFPSGLSEEAVVSIVDRIGLASLETLYRFSMAELRETKPMRA